MRPIEIHDRGRGPELKGTRTTVYDIIPFRLAGRSPTYIAAALGHSTDEIEALFRYMDEHYDEVMAVHQQIEERIARGNPPEVEDKLKHSRAKLLAKMEEIRRRKEQANGDGHPG
ncbi:MAG TPA: hypothetical protein VM597_17755 [Gemmataceae bacterium]|nr:hypothetical protein [Gemmataceae bacterium]